MRTILTIALFSQEKPLYVALVKNFKYYI